MQNENGIEIWRDIPNYEGKYQVSSLGRVKSLNYRRTNQEKILRLGKDKDGYLLVALCKNGKMKTCKVHRLVAQAFIENTNNLPCVNHKNEIKTDNRVDNLEWCDAKYNTNYGTFQARRVANTDYKSFQARRVEKLTNGILSKKVYQYDKNGTLIKIWDSVNEVGRNGFHSGHISQCCRNCYLRKGNNIYKNYIWSYHPIN